MYEIQTPNGTSCIVLERANSTQYFDENIIRVINKEIRGPKQARYVDIFLAYGYIINRASKEACKSVDNLIDRIQKKFIKLGKLADNYNHYKIYYGQIGRNNEFGYYLQYEG